MAATVLITNSIVAGRTGTEVVTEQLADGLRRTGLHPIVYAPVLGGLARAMRARGHVLVDRLDAVPIRPDVIHGQHTGPTMAALTAFPNVPAVFVSHSILASYDRPPRHPRIRRYFAVSELVRKRVASDGIQLDRVQLLRQAVDLDRFRQRAPLPERPRRALALTKNTAHLGGVEEACDAAGIELDVCGPSTGRFSEHPEELLCSSDLVFATGRNALEAAAVGCSVVVCDALGFAGRLTSANADAWCRLNLAVGLQAHPTTIERLASAIASYDPADAARVCATVRRDAALDAQVAELVAVYDQIRSEGPADRGEEAAATAAFLEDYVPTQTSDRPWLRLARDVYGELPFRESDVVLKDTQRELLTQMNLHAERLRSELVAEVSALRREIGESRAPHAASNGVVERVRRLYRRVVPARIRNPIGRARRRILARLTE